MKRALPLLALTALLAACDNGGGVPTPGPGPAPTYTVSGEVIAPGGVALTTLGLASSANWDAPHVPGQVLVTTGSTLGAQSLTVLSGVRTQRLDDTLTLAFTPGGETDPAFAARLTAAGLQTQPNYLYHALAVPNDPGYPDDQPYLLRINAQNAWDAFDAKGQAPTGPIVAVLDTGVDATHPDLTGRLLPGRDFCGSNDLSNCTIDNTPEDTGGHGTASVGLIGAATNNARGMAGLTWTGRNILPVKVFGGADASTVTVRQGIEYAVQQGAKVINMSLGGPGASDPDPLMHQAIQAAVAANVTVVASAGNTPGDGVYYPAAYPEVIAVGAAARNGTLSCFSARPTATRPRQLDLIAPGGNSTVGTCQGESDDLIVSLTTGGGYAYWAGTSESAPLVSGVAALMRGINPNLTATQTRQLLKSTATTVSGGALLNAGAAVRAAATATPAPDPVPNTYDVTVQAFSGSTVVNTFKGQLKSGDKRLPYTLNLPAGTYTLRATITGAGKTYRGEANVQLNANKQVNIQTQ
ncbi:S8 family serine peptidase [Deinococcus maricopensis]|nr:S8 family serine peptidase [Deinococcus maricopensis]